MLKKLLFSFLVISICGLNCNCSASENTPHLMAGEELYTQSYVQDAYEAANKGVEVVFPFVESEVYKVYLQQGFITDIRLEENEKLKYLSGGDSLRWTFDNTVTGTPGNLVTHVFAKPIERGITTNLVITTDKRNYQLLLVSGNSFNPMVRWKYTSSMKNFDTANRIKNYASINPGEVKFGFSFSNIKYAWSPESGFRTESKSYLKMKKEISTSELPVLFVLDDDNKPTMVSYRFQNGYFVIDRLFKKARLLLGEKHIDITFKEQ